MQEAQRVEHIERLIDGIQRIGPGSSFERFGAKFLNHHLGVELVHRGLNVQLSPVGHTVDSVNDEGSVAAEYSIEKNYFQSKWTKPTDDMLHVLRMHPAVVDIYLLSSQVSSASEIKAAQARTKEWPGFHDRIIHYYDARRIAEVIVDEMLLDHSAVLALVEHLPVLERVLNEHRATLTVPAIDPRRVELVAVDRAIDIALTDSHPVAVISGIAGSGKSDAAAAYVNSRRGLYQTTMWVEGMELTKISDLASKRLWRGGADLNVAGMLEAKRCLLVIDDMPPSIEVAELEQLCGSGSRILVTKRESNSTDICIPPLQSPEARLILDRDVAESCPEKVLQTLMRAVGGHPLSLALVNKAVSSGVSWAEIEEDCDVIATLIDGRERLADRILGRMKPTLAKELAVFDWLGQSSCDIRLLRFLVRSPGMINLGGQGLRAVDRPTLFRLHDVVYASLKVLGWLSQDYAAELDKKLDDHLSVLIQEESLALLILATTMQAKLEAIARVRYSAPVLVALLAVWRPDDVLKDVLGNPGDRLSAFKARGTSVAYVEVRLILESIESLYRLDKQDSVETAKENLKDRLPLFDLLLSLPVANPRSSSEILHHQGKALKLIGRTDDAIKVFEAVLAGAFPLDASRLQLIRLYRTDSRAVDLADEVLTAARMPNTVTSSVTLGVVENLSWAKGTALDALFVKHTDLIESEIISAAQAGLEQAYSALASVGRYWGWNDCERLKKVFAAIPVPTVDSANDRTSAALGEILMKLAKSGYPHDRSLQEQAICYFRSIAKPDDFVLQKHGEILIDLKIYDEAVQVLSLISCLERDSFACYRLSQAELGLVNPEKSLEYIDIAITGLDASKQKFAASFWAQRYKVRCSQGAIDAIEDLNKAIAACEPGKYLDYLQKLLVKVQ